MMPSAYDDPEAYSDICRFWLSMVIVWKLNSTYPATVRVRGASPVFDSRTSHTSTGSARGTNTVWLASIPR